MYLDISLGIKYTDILLTVKSLIIIGISVFHSFSGEKNTFRDVWKVYRVFLLIFLREHHEW